MFPSFCVLLFFSLSVSCTSDKRREAFISANWFIFLLRATSGHSASRYLAARRSTLFSTINQNIWLQSTFLEITHQFKLSVNILKAVLSADEQSLVWSFTSVLIVGILDSDIVSRLSQRCCFRSTLGLDTTPPDYWWGKDHVLVFGIFLSPHRLEIVPKSPPEYPAVSLLWMLKLKQAAVAGLKVIKM